MNQPGDAAGLALAGILFTACSRAPITEVEPKSAIEPAPFPADKLSAWDRPLRGAVYQSGHVDRVEEDVAAARAYGFTLLRVFFPAKEDEDTRAKSLDLPGAMTPEDVNDLESAYFSSERFERALERLDATIACARAQGLFVVLAPGAVPGSHGKGPVRWRLFRNFRWHRELASHWRRLAQRYRGEPCVIGYELLNEPGFEVTSGVDVTDAAALADHARSLVGSPGDLNLLYRKVAAAIREVDAGTPIVVEPGCFGAPRALAGLDPLEDERVIYSVHFYEPWLYTTWRMNRGRWSYPGAAPHAGREDPENPGALVEWDSARIRSALVEPVETWRRRHAIPATRVYLGEYGSDRRVRGSVTWLGDVVTAADDAGWHWTFYAFRERPWDAMDYELGVDAENHVQRSAELLRPMLDAKVRAAR